MPAHATLAKSILAAILLLGIAVSCGQPLARAPESTAGGSESQAATEPPAPADCSAGVAKDDGTIDTGYGFVPSARWGLYLQSFNSSELPGRQIDRVCVAWLRNRPDSEIDFEVVFFAKEQGRPTEEPYAAVAAKAVDVPESRRDGTGKLIVDTRFYPVDISGVTVPEGESYIGVRWNPSVDRFFFVGADLGDEGQPANVFQKEDRAPGWQSILVSNDPMFAKHRAMMLRVEASAPAAPAPAE